MPPPPSPSAAAVPTAGRWRQHRLFSHERFTAAAPLAAVLLFLAAIAASFWYLRSEEAQREQEAVKRDLEYGQQYLRLRLRERQEQLMRLAREAAGGELDAGRFAVQAEALVAQFPELLAVSWIDAHGRVRATRASPSQPAARGWMQGGALAPGVTLDTWHQARHLLQPVYSPPVMPADTGPGGTPDRPPPAPPCLQLHVPLLHGGDFGGVILAEYALDALLRYGMPAEVLARYAVALLDGQGTLLAGQSIPARHGLAGYLPWANRINAFTLPASPMTNGLALRAQAWRTSQSVVSNALFWLVAALSVLTVWMLIANWRHTRTRQQAQAALLAETTFRRAMENSMRTGMRALDMQGRITYVNPAFCQMTGWSEAELVGCAEPFPYWPGSDHAMLSARLREELRGSADASDFQMRVLRKDGSLFDARFYVSPLIDATGRQSGWMASMTDITEPNRVRRELSASHDRFTTVLEALDASVSVAPLGSQELLFANKLYRQWFGATTAGHLGLVARAGSLQAAATSDDDGQDAVDAFAGMPTSELPGSQADNAEIHLPELDKWLEVRSRYLHWVDGRLAQMVIATDITARRLAEQRAEEQAERAEAASRLITMGEMASSVAHELNQPLTAISNYCTGMISRLQGGGIGPQDLLVPLEKTARQAQRAGQVVQHIRSFVKRSEPKRQPTSAAAIVEAVMELAEVEARRRQVRLTHHVAPGLPPLHADPILIEQVLLNLIKNAAEAVDTARRPPPAPRSVELRVGLLPAPPGPNGPNGPRAVLFSVSDSGTGLPPEVLERLYEAFFSTKREGMGIGLNLCRSIVESHQGRIEAENLYNAGLVTGCRFSFWIPAGAAPEPADTLPTPIPG